MNWSQVLCRRPAEDESVRELRQALHSQGIPATRRQCETPDEVRDLEDLLDPDAARPSDLAQPGGFRREFIRKASPSNLYAHSSLTLLLLPTLQSRMFDSYWSVMDGFFIGDRDSAEDIKLFHENKVTRVINCAADAIDNYWEAAGVSYLNYSFKDEESQVILDDDDKVANEVFNFIEEAVAKGEGVLVQSFRGQSRSCVVLAAYMMKKYQWSLHETLEYLSFKCPVLHPNDSFLSQLEAYELRLDLAAYELGVAGNRRGKPLVQPQYGDEIWDGSVLSNTFKNCQRAPLSDMQIQKHSASPDRAPAVKFVDNVADIKPYLVGSALDLDPCDSENQKPWRVPEGTPPPKSALKSGKKKVSPYVADPAPVESDDISGFVTIQRRSGAVTCRPDEIVPRRFGIQLHNRSILLEYTVPRLGVRAHHTMVVDLGGPKATWSKSSGSSDESINEAIAEALQKQHEAWLATVSVEQLAALVGRLRAADEEQKQAQKKKEPERRKRAPGKSPR